MATSTIKLPVVKVNVTDVDGTATPADYPLGLTVERNGSTAGQFPTNYANILTIKTNNSRAIQICIGNYGIFGYRIAASGSTWGEWFTVSHT